MNKKDAELVLDRIAKAVAAAYQNHPFRDKVTRTNVESVVGNYCAMSMAFPYLQAGASYRAFEHYMRHGFDVARDVQVTAVVGAFLCWDEFGGHAKICAQGNRGLSSILDISGTHANLFKQDMRRILGRDILPLWSPATTRYLKALHYGLSSVDPTTRVAAMVGFERHANDMITALWQSIVQLFGVKREELSYFDTHVGGDDPAESYHVDMTGRMIAEVITYENCDRLIDEAVAAYGLNFIWCEQLTGLPPLGATTVSAEEMDAAA